MPILFFWKSRCLTFSNISEHIWQYFDILGPYGPYAPMGSYLEPAIFWTSHISNQPYLEPAILWTSHITNQPYYEPAILWTSCVMNQSYYEPGILWTRHIMNPPLGEGDGDDGGGRIFPEHPSPILHAPRDNISRKGNPSLRLFRSSSE